MTLRMLQGIQGKLIEEMDQKLAPLQLVLTVEEMTTLKVVIRELLTFYAAQLANPERIATLPGRSGRRERPSEEFLGREESYG